MLTQPTAAGPQPRPSMVTGLKANRTHSPALPSPAAPSSGSWGHILKSGLPAPVAHESPKELDASLDLPSLAQDLPLFVWPFYELQPD